MKVAFISDIHSNPNALTAVLEDIKQRGIDTTYCLGDIIGYHTFPNETIKILAQSSVIAIKGNHDLDVLNKKFNPEKELDIFEWTYNTLTEENRAYIVSLPNEIEVEIEGWKIKICHGSPESVELYCHEGTAYTEKIMEELKEDVLVCGHTHLPYHKMYGTKHIINSGSVGKPKIGRPNATYALATITTENILVEIVELTYDFNPVADHVESCGFKKYADHLRTGIVS